MITDKHGFPDCYGSLGAILGERGELNDEYYAITAGHVVAGGMDFEITHRIIRTASMLQWYLCEMGTKRYPFCGSGCCKTRYIARE